MNDITITEDLASIVDMINKERMTSYKSLVDYILKEFGFKSKFFTLTVEYSSFFVFYIPSEIEEKPKTASVENMKEEIRKLKKIV